MATYHLNIKENGAVLCQSCHQENKMDATVCAHCGQPLPTQTTIIVPEKSAQAAQRFQISEVVEAFEDSLVLYVMGDNQPVVIRGEGEIILGRHSDTDPQPNLDLTRYKAHTLGVSRHHARMRPTDDGYTLEDMGSSNGTFINEHKLVAHNPVELKSGDLVRLGQLMIFTYFSPKQSTVKPLAIEQALPLSLKDSAEAKPSTDGIDVAFINTVIVPFIKAASEMQMLLDEILNRKESKGLLVREIALNAATDFSLMLRLFGYSDATQLVKSQLADWTKKVGDVPTSDETGPVVEDKAASADSPSKSASEHSAEETVVATDSAKQPADSEDVKAAKEPLIDSYDVIAKSILGQFKDLSEAKRSDYVAKFKPLIELLVKSDLKITTT